MSSSDDFLTWSDLDLDELLGDYTDDDFQSLDSSVSECESSDGERGTRPTISTKKMREDKDKPSSKVTIYDCPQCAKQFKSVSGFRGHVMKQHPIILKGGFKGMLVA